jgi:hypothetical protein
MSGSRRSKSALTREEALAFVPERNQSVREEHPAQDHVRLVYPVVHRPLVRRLMRLAGRGGERVMERRVDLDILGTRVWFLIDGTRTVRVIVREFALAHGLDTLEAEAAVTRFLRSLGRRGLIGLRRP